MSIQKDAMLVPQRAVVETQGQYSVVVIGADNKASVRSVKMGDRTGQMWIVTEGLKPGERIVVEGVQKARDGVVVNPTQAVASTQGE